MTVFYLLGWQSDWNISATLEWIFVIHGSQAIYFLILFPLDNFSFSSEWIILNGFFKCILIHCIHGIILDLDPKHSLSACMLRVYFLPGSKHFKINNVSHVTLWGASASLCYGHYSLLPLSGPAKRNWSYSCLGKTSSNGYKRYVQSKQIGVGDMDEILYCHTYNFVLQYGYLVVNLIENPLRNCILLK